MIRIGLIQFPGSNCERETALAVKRAGMEPVEFLWNEPLEKLRHLHGYILVGGFSYEDRSRAGIIAALDPVIQEIKTQSEQGKPVLGICNGAQILVESGLVPALEGERHDVPMALTENKRIMNHKIIGTGFYNAWVHMRLSDKHQHNAFTRHLSSKDLIHLPIAHAQGRFLMPDSLLNQIEEQGLNLFQYCNAEGAIIDNFPINPNGSAGNIAAITNRAGNVMAMMPHPERTVNGDPIFTSMRDYIKDNCNLDANNIRTKGSPSRIMPPPPKPHQKSKNFIKNPGSYLCLVKLIITDNQALTVQKTLRRLGFPVTVHRFEHWEIDCDSLESFELLKKTGLLYSDRKEREILLTEFRSSNASAYLVRPQEDLKGQQTLQTLKIHYAIPEINKINHGVLWQFTSDEVDVAMLTDRILLTHIIGNPHAHECYNYSLS
ncbi:phosphoribosylformylglycinamidine synthase I [Legionella longbeachae]|uniref:Phosphoribosylformylglycinamidine synthase I (FGAM synthase I) n=1 Tax=Legionella longbeachae serogroup 1 (strain NSW150) TaxID=661367 RepID=D3HMP0_LEGLN|nr:phosphoribosylformylglycinamidine synthase I [Legionella longbeachae]VEE04241.1 phosphoribosylformylglycinamidine synthase I (FGAM synthase I) [Legionella oakridgensis]HBD7397011.1 phosphoribosylformylglycinamidine synthase I [Legionella pneumophila]ARB92931.1 phosphoribosylformylglycinamidine synthase I [Legionella longbeachae]ARM33929.1 phosphoribosylformylglycinamidine synthase I [Legionella longbeachae]EEZ96868.1 phosphoribosylformylglycinamidine synthase I [Legionella longbeachae D-496